MQSQEAEAIIKKGLSHLLTDDNKKSMNSAIWSVSKDISVKCNAEVREAKKKAVAEAKPAKPVKEKKADINDKIQEFIDNPMSKEEEGKALRAIYHAQLSTGELSPQFLDKIDKILGVASDEDELIQVVDFKDAFPDLATAVEVCMQPQPKICECGGVKR